MTADPRERLRADIEERYEKLLEMLDAGMDKNAKMRIDDPCAAKGCGCKHVRYIEVPDYKTKLAIAEFVMNQGFGRPAQAESERDDEKIVFKRLVKLEDETG